MDQNKESAAKELISKEVSAVALDPSRIKENGCAACHVLFALVNRLELSEADAADMLTEVLLSDHDLNDRFIEMVENIHMKQRMMGAAFALKTRDAKDRYIESQFRNALEELLSDTAGYGVNIVLRRLLVSYMALELAQNLGIDYHAATEELYYYMRKNDKQTHSELMGFVESILQRGRHR